MTMNTKSFVYITLTVICVALGSNSYAQKTESQNIAKEKAKSLSPSKEAKPSDEALNQVTNRILLLQPTFKKIKDKEAKKLLANKIWSVCPNYPKERLSELSKEEINMWLSSHFSEGVAYVEFLGGLKEEMNTSR
jgi:hypothetical protein